MTESSSDDRAPLVRAADWGIRTSTVAITMVVPAFLGYWLLDSRLGTGILFTALGLALGMAAGIMQLVRMVKYQQRADSGSRQPGEREEG